MMVELVLIDIMLLADPGGRALCVGMWPFVCWDCGFESRRGGGGWMSFVNVVCGDV